MLPNNNLRIQTLEHLPLSTLVDAFNAAFEGYFVSIHFTLDILKQKIKTEDISLDLSTGVFDGPNLVAFMFHGIRSSKAYNAGTGVLPAYRKQGLVGRMYQFQFQRLQQADINEVVLEVIVENIAAIKAYKNAGFSIKRQLICYKGHIPHSSTLKSKQITIEELEGHEINSLTSFWNYIPTWQHQSKSVQNIQAQTKGICLVIDGQVIAYGIIIPDTGRILQLAVHQKYRRQGFGKLLLQSLSNLGSPHLSILNVDSRDITTNQFFQQLGFEVSIEQYEMSTTI